MSKFSRLIQEEHSERELHKDEPFKTVNLLLSEW